MTHPRRRLDLATSRLLTLPTEPWLSCDDCFRLLDAYVEQAHDGEAMRVHLAGCPACAEEAASLRELLEADRAAE